MTTKRISSWMTALALAGALLAVMATHATAEKTEYAKATFAGGCFWCVEEAFEKVSGVISATSGYIGGNVDNPTYKQVTSGQTGHAEAVEVIYDPAQITYEQLLDVFWRNVDPTVVDRQFCDFGDQYRTAIFVHGDEQMRLAEASKKALEESKPFAGAHCHANRRGLDVLSRRGLPPGLLQAQPAALQVLQMELRSRPAA